MSCNRVWYCQLPKVNHEKSSWNQEAPNEAKENLCAWSENADGGGTPSSEPKMVRGKVETVPRAKSGAAGNQKRLESLHSMGSQPGDVPVSITNKCLFSRMKPTG